MLVFDIINPTTCGFFNRDHSTSTYAKITSFSDPSPPRTQSVRKPAEPPSPGTLYAEGLKTSVVKYAICNWIKMAGCNFCLAMYVDFNTVVHSANHTTCGRDTGNAFYKNHSSAISDAYLFCFVAYAVSIFPQA